MIDLRYVKKLIEMIDESSVDSVEILTEKGVKIRIAKSPTQRGGVAMGAPMHLAAMMHASMADSRAPALAGSPPPAPEAVAPARAEPATSLLEVKSPMVGTYYTAPEPGAKPYVSVGDRVTKGKTLCIIEAMKIMNEIESEYTGVVKDVLAQDAQPVEYGQVLFRIDPNG
ncbi:MAG: acetyl-CoA carboxylase biotin carboxyl carrier protein [Gemmatimonadaceae bacterium]